MLQESSKSSNSNSKIEIHESPSGGVFIHGATHVLVTSQGDVDVVTARGLANRAVASTKCNDHSSRSHMVLIIDVETRVRCIGVETSGKILCSGRLSLVDLAGSERISKSEATGSALTEAKHINKSLSSLIDVIAALSDRDKKVKQAASNGVKTSSGDHNAVSSHIPFRNSKLTHLLMGSMKPGSKLVFITQVSYINYIYLIENWLISVYIYIL